MSQRKSKCKDSELLATLQPHTDQHPVVTMEEIELKEKEMMCFTMQLSRALRMGKAHGHGISIPKLTAKFKDNKEVMEGQSVEVRAVCGAEESPN